MADPAPPHRPPPGGIDFINTFLDESVAVSSSDDVGLAKDKRRTAAFKLLIDCFALQIRYGCDDKECRTPSCFSFRKSQTHEPVRRPTMLTARSEAFVLASTNEPLKYLCIHPLRTNIDGDGRVDPGEVRAYISWLMLSGIPGEERIQTVAESEHEGNSINDISLHVDNELRDSLAAMQPADFHELHTKVDKGSLTQNLFNSALMRAWFADSRKAHSPTLDLTYAIHETLAVEHGLSLLKLAESLRSDEKRRQIVLAYALDAIRHSLSSPTRLIKQWTTGAPRTPLASLTGLSFKAIADSRGKLINSIETLDRPMVTIFSFSDVSMRKHICDSLWNGLDAIFTPPIELRTSSSTGGIRQAMDDSYLDDDAAAHIIFIAIRTLLKSMPTSSERTLAAVLHGRALGQSAPISLSLAQSKHPQSAVAQEARLNTADSFEFQPALRLAEKIVLALATRRAHWLALSQQRNPSGLFPRRQGTNVFPVLYLVMAHMTAQAIRHVPPEDEDDIDEKREIDLAKDSGLDCGPLLLEWLKTVFRATWDGKHTLGRWCAAGAALEIIKDIRDLYPPRKPNIWGLKPQHFEIPILVGHLHAHKIIPDYLGWMQAHPKGSQRHKNERHLLEYPFVFERGYRSFYFRLMMYQQMHHEWQSARGHREIQYHFLWSYAPNGADFQCSDQDCNHAMCERVRILNRQTRQWHEAGYDYTQRFPSNFWNRDAYLRTKLAKAQGKFLLLDIERQNILESALSQLWGREKRELLKPLKVVMRMDGKDEDAADHGGVSQEFFRLVLAKAFDPEYGLFVVPDEQANMNWFQPLSLEPLQTYELLGLLLGMAIYNGITIPINFPYALYHILCEGTNSGVIGISDGWPTLAKSLQQLEAWDEEKNGTIEDVFARDFAFTFEANGAAYTIDMLKEDPCTVKWPRIRSESTPTHWTDDTRAFEPVTHANRADFIQAYREWLVIHSVKPQLDAFVKGFHHIVPTACATFLTAASLQAFVEGNRNIDLNLLRAATSYPAPSSSASSPPTTQDEYSPVHPTIRYFWNVVSKYDQAKLRKLLTFVTANDRVPAQGYHAIGFSVEKHGAADSLPTSSTCFGKLFLPPYESEEVLQKMLGIAVEEGSAGFGFM